MVEINYSQVRIKEDTRSGRWAVATVGGSIKSPNKQNTQQSCSGSITEIAGAFLKGERERQRFNKWNRDNSYVCWHKGGVGSVGLQGLTNGCVDISTRNTPGRSCRAVRREPRHSPCPSLSYTVNTTSPADSTIEDWYFHKLNTIVHIDLCTNAWLFSSILLPRTTPVSSINLILYLPLGCERASFGGRVKRKFIEGGLQKMQDSLYIHWVLKRGL